MQKKLFMMVLLFLLIVVLVNPSQELEKFLLQKSGRKLGYQIYYVPPELEKAWKIALAQFFSLKYEQKKLKKNA